MRTINNLKCKQPEQQYSFQENLEYNLPELVYKSIQIDDKGNLFPKYEAIGDIAHAPRLGINALGNVNDDVEITTMFEKNLINTKRFVTKQFINEPCSQCEYNQYCANSGFHVYNYVLNKAAKNDINVALKVNENIKKMGCPHVAKNIFKHYESVFDSLAALNKD